MKKKLLRLFAFCLVLSVAAPAMSQTGAPPDLDSYVARALKEFAVPGLAIAIVKDGKVVLAIGYGVKRLGEPAPVDEQTLFGIASNTKAFTAAALAILVDEGKIGWDDPVTKHLPGFQMYDPYVTREITVRDLLTHRSGLGLGAGDLLFFPPTTFTRDEIVARLRYIKPATSFRSKYAYDNVLYLVAGQVVAAVSGKSWDDFIKERIFAPLSMTASNTSIKDLRPGGNFISPHQKVEGRLQPVPYMNLDNTADHYLNAPATDWVSGFRAVTEQQIARAKEVENQQSASRNTESKPSLPPAKYAGRYTDAWYGEVAIALENGKLVLRFSRTPGMVGDLEYWQYDTFVARWRDRSLNADAFVTFTLKPDGSIEQMKMVPVSPLTDFSFDFQDLLFTPVPGNATGKL